MSDDRHCPHCGYDGDYEHDGKTFSRLIMVEIPGVYDGGLFMACPACRGAWHRWTGDNAYNAAMRRKAQHHIDSWNQRAGVTVDAEHAT